MIIAHPDDEIIFGANDLLNSENEVTVICYTGAKHKIRRPEFFKSMRLAKAKGYMLSLHDSMEDNWSYHTTDDLVKMALDYGSDYDIIVSHDKNGEYGHIQHKRLHIVAKAMAKQLGIPFHGFKSRYNKRTLNIALKNKILKEVYKSQKGVIDNLENYAEKHYRKNFTRKNRSK